MAGLISNLHSMNFLGLVLLLVVWIVLFECAHLLLLLLHDGPLVGWAIGPFGVTGMFLQEPSLLSIWFNVFFPACVSAFVLYIGLFTSFAPVRLPYKPLLQALMIGVGVLLSSAVDFANALRDLRHPLWGDARILRNIQTLRASWCAIHFTRYGLTYLRDNFDSNPTELLQMM